MWNYKWEATNTALFTMDKTQKHFASSNANEMLGVGNSCLYHAELPNNISDIALVNTSNQTLNFYEGGYPSVTVSAHGTAIQHMGAPAATTMKSNQTSTTAP